MTIDQFIEILKEYYGEPKRPGIVKWLKAYLSRDVNTDRLQELYRFLIHTHSATSLNSPFPSVKEIEDAVKHAQKESGVDLRPKRESSWRPPDVPEEERIEFENEGDMFAAIFKNIGKVVGDGED